MDLSLAILGGIVKKGGLKKGVNRFPLKKAVPLPNLGWKGVWVKVDRLDNLKNL